MPDYMVVWRIELNAESPRDAAQQAREIQLDPTSIATSFVVVAQEPPHRKTVVDLLALSQSAALR